ncbi:MAG: ribosomal protein S18-alanine N-acetyltransferase [Pyrinomonadaceae bacterium]
MNPSCLRIKSIDASHIGELIRIGEETGLSPWSAKSYLEEMKNPSAIMLRLVDEENTIVSFIVGRIILGGEIETQMDAEIFNIAVTGQNQRRGCGQRLFDEFVNKCRENEVARVWLEVRESNEKAIKFYEKNGFESVQTRPSFYSNPREHALVMLLILSEPAL